MKMKQNHPQIHHGLSAVILSVILLAAGFMGYAVLDALANSFFSWPFCIALLTAVARMYHNETHQPKHRGLPQKCEPQ